MPPDKINLPTVLLSAVMFEPTNSWLRASLSPVHHTGQTTWPFTLLVKLNHLRQTLHLEAALALLWIEKRLGAFESLLAIPLFKIQTVAICKHFHVAFNEALTCLTQDRLICHCISYSTYVPLCQTSHYQRQGKQFHHQRLHR